MTPAPNSEATPAVGLCCDPVVVRLGDVAPVAVRWLWPGRVALGKVTLIAGDPGLGKSFLTLDMAARVSAGVPWPDTPADANPAGGVVLLSAEDDLSDTIRPRLDAAGADVSRIVALQAIREPTETGDRVCPFCLSTDLPALEAAIQQTPGCRLVIIDPISAYLGAKVDSHVNADVRAVLMPLGELAAKHGVAIVAVTHLRKGDGAAVYRAMGSLAFVAAARAVWGVAKCKDDPTGKRRLFIPVKNNLSNDEGGLAYRLLAVPGNSARVDWEPNPVNLQADDALAPPERKRGPEPEVRADVEHWLQQTLCDGPRLAKDMLDEARNGYGFSGKTVERARQRIGVQSFRPANPGPWWWKLPGAQRQSTTPTPPTYEQPDVLDVVLKNKGKTHTINRCTEQNATFCVYRGERGIVPLAEPAERVPAGWTPRAWARELRRQAEACEMVNPGAAEDKRRRANRIVGVA